MDKKKKVLSDFKHSLKIKVSWGDMDALGHINNVVFFRYFEDIRISFFEKIKIDSKTDTFIGPVISDISCKFSRPIYYPSHIIAACSVCSVRDDRFVLSYGLFNEKDYICLAIGESTVMAFDFKSKVKVNLPLIWKEGLEKEILQ